MHTTYNSLKKRLLLRVAEAASKKAQLTLPTATTRKNYIEKYKRLFELILDTISQRAVLRTEKWPIQMASGQGLRSSHLSSK